jgi:uncharacterized membrane protein
MRSWNEVSVVILFGVCIPLIRSLATAMSERAILAKLKEARRQAAETQRTIAKQQEVCCRLILFRPTFEM